MEHEKQTSAKKIIFISAIILVLISVFISVFFYRENRRTDTNIKLSLSVMMRYASRIRLYTRYAANTNAADDIIDIINDNDIALENISMELSKIYPSEYYDKINNQFITLNLELNKSYRRLGSELQTSYDNFVSTLTEAYKSYS